MNIIMMDKLQNSQILIYYRFLIKWKAMRRLCSSIVSRQTSKKNITSRRSWLVADSG